MGEYGLDDVGSSGPRAAAPVCQMRTREPGLDLTCTKVAVDFQSITVTTADERFTSGAAIAHRRVRRRCGVRRRSSTTTAGFDKVYSGRSTFSACNPGRAEGRATLAEFPWIKSRLEHLRLLEIRDTSKRRSRRATMPRTSASLNVGALLVVGFNIRGRLGGILGVCSATSVSPSGPSTCISR